MEKKTKSVVAKKDSRSNYLNVLLCLLDGCKSDFELSTVYVGSDDAYLNVMLKMDFFSSDFLKRIPVPFEVIGMSNCTCVRFTLPRLLNDDDVLPW